jgi:arylsulfatase A-like enzyme
MDRREFLKTSTCVLAGGFLLSSCRRPWSSTKKPNVLLIMADQLRHDALGYAGAPVRTPNLDALAACSHRLEDCYVPSPICVASRATLFTGTYPFQHGILVNAARKKVVGELLPDLLMQAGYTAALAGKRHIVSPRLKKVGAGPEERKKYASAKPWIVPKDHGELWASPCGERTRFRADWVARESMAFLDRQKGSERPFFLWTSFIEPHAMGSGIKRKDLDAFSPEEGRHWDAMYRRENMPVPRRLSGEFSNKPKMLQKDIARWHAAGDDAEIREATARYYGTISMLDKHVGRVLKRLRDNGQWENTVIVFMSDHGEFLGEHGLYRKRNCLYDCLTRVPALIKLPGQRRGEIHGGFVSEVDLTATLHELCEAFPRKPVQGESLLPFLKGGKAVRDHVFLEMGVRQKHIQGVRDKDFLYVSWPGGEGELYDLKKDPFQLRNLFHDRRMETVKKRLRALLEKDTALRY